MKPPPHGLGFAAAWPRTTGRSNLSTTLPKGDDLFEGNSVSGVEFDCAMLEQALRDDLDARAPRATAVLKPIRLIIDNYPADKFQFERDGYFVADRKDHWPEVPVFNLAVSLKDSRAR